MRAGSQTITLLGTPRTFLVLRSLAEGTKGGLELRRDAGSPAQSTMRGHLRLLEETGAIAKRRRDSFPGTLEYDLTDSGRELLAVAESLEHWLADAPQGQLELGGDQARAAVKGLAESWTSTVLTTLAAEPLSLTELDKQITVVSYPTIERCLENMRLAEQLEVRDRSGRGTPYAITDWLRRGITPLALGARWEHRNSADDADSISRNDLDGALQLTRPLFKVSKRLSGSCQVELKDLDGDGHDHLFGLIEVANGKLAFGSFYPEVNPDVRAAGAIDTWFSTLIDTDTSSLELKGDHDLAKAIFSGLNHTLFKDMTTNPTTSPKDAVKRQ